MQADTENPGMTHYDHAGLSVFEVVTLQLSAISWGIGEAFGVDITTAMEGEEPASTIIKNVMDKLPETLTEYEDKFGGLDPGLVSTVVSKVVTEQFAAHFGFDLKQGRDATVAPESED